MQRLFQELDGHGGVDLQGMFPLLFQLNADVLAPGLSRVYRALARSGSFPVGWRTANITPIPKGPSSADPTIYRPISIAPVLLKVCERLLVGKLSVFSERNDALPARQYAYRKELRCRDALLDICHQAQTVLEKDS